MSAMLGSHLERIRSADALTRVALPLLGAPVLTEAALEAVSLAVVKVEALSSEISGSLDQAHASFASAQNIVDTEYLKESEAALLRLGRAARETVEGLRELQPRVSGEAAALLGRFLSAEAAIHQDAIGLALECHSALQELDHEAKTDPVLASLLDAPEDDEPFTDRHRREVRESLLSGHAPDEPGRRHA